mmetsp:Transcript_82789/g.129277  ORF Transcript_82789/g.129277 Transcript_82789/m.129277 type:complete len:100 (-) Transcript_82789:18-317(-)
MDSEVVTDAALEADLRQLEAAIAAGDCAVAREVAIKLARQRVVVNCELDHEVATAGLRKQLQAKLIDMGFPPAKVVQALRRGNAQSASEAVAWLASQAD